MNKANQATQKADQDSQEIAQLRGVIANLDDYKLPGGEREVRAKS
jgi:hypothetical protein